MPTDQSLLEPFHSSRLMIDGHKKFSSQFPSIRYTSKTCSNILTFLITKHMITRPENSAFTFTHYSLFLSHVQEKVLEKMHYSHEIN